jgi:cobalamin biosynthesis protein CobD/CbiB
VLAILNAAFGLLSAVMLLVLQGIPPLLWLGQGIAAPIQWFTAAALLLDRKMLQNTAVLPLLFFGTLPMLASPWGGWWLMPQLSRLVMTVTALYILGESVIGRKYREMAVGLAAGGVAVLLLFLILPWCCGG